MSTKTTTSLEEEAQEYRQKKLGRPAKNKNKPLTARIYLAGQALAGLLASHQGRGRAEDIKDEAYNWADKMLDD